MNQMSEEEIRDVDWDAELLDIGHDEKMNARLDVHTEAIQKIIEEWMQTTVWAKSPETEDDTLDINNDPFEGADKTSLGEVASIPILNLFGFLMHVGGVDPDDLNTEAIRDHKGFIMGVTASLITEGIMIANSPGWAEKVDAATKGLRDIEFDSDIS